MTDSVDMSEDCLLESLDDFNELLPVDSQSGSIKEKFAEEGEILTSEEDGSLLDHALETIGEPVESKTISRSKTQISSSDKLCKTMSSKENLSAESPGKKVKKEKKKAKKELKKLKKRRKELLSSVDEFSEESEVEFGVAKRKKASSGEKFAKKRKFSFEDLNPDDADPTEDSHQDRLNQEDLHLDQYSDDSEIDLRIRLENKRRRRLKNAETFGVGNSRHSFNFRRGRLKSSEDEGFVKNCKSLRKSVKEGLKKKEDKKNHEVGKRPTKRIKSSSKSKKDTGKKRSKKRRSSTNLVCISSDSDDSMVTEKAKSQNISAYLPVTKTLGASFDNLLQQRLNDDVFHSSNHHLYQQSDMHELSQNSYQLDYKFSSDQTPGPSSLGCFEPSTGCGWDEFSQSQMSQDTSSFQYASDQHIYSSIASPPKISRLAFPKPNSVSAPHLGYIVENGWANLDELMNEFVDKQLRLLQESMKTDPDDSATSERLVTKTENMEDANAPAFAENVTQRREESTFRDNSLPLPIIVKEEVDNSVENVGVNLSASTETRIPNHLDEQFIKQEPRDDILPDTFIHDRNSNVFGKQGFESTSQENLYHQAKSVNQLNETPSEKIINRSFTKGDEFDIDHELDVPLNQASESGRCSKSPVNSISPSDMSRSSTPESFSSSFHSYDSSSEMHDASFASRENQEPKNVAQTPASKMIDPSGAVEITLDIPDYISSSFRGTSMDNPQEGQNFEVKPAEMVRDENILKEDVETKVPRTPTPEPVKRIAPTVRSSGIEKSDSEFPNRCKPTSSSKSNSGPNPNDESANETLQISENIRSLFAGSNTAGVDSAEASSVDILSNLSSRISGEVIDHEPKSKISLGTYELMSKNVKVKKSASEQISISGIPDPRLLPGNRKNCASRFQSKFVRLRYWCKAIFMERNRESLINLEPIELLPGDQMTDCDNTSVRDPRLSAPLLKDVNRPSESMLSDDSEARRRHQKANLSETAANQREKDSGPNNSRSRKDIRPIPLERIDGLVSSAEDPRLSCSQYPLVNRPCTILSRVKFSIDQSLKTNQNNHLNDFDERTVQNNYGNHDALPINHHRNRNKLALLDPLPFTDTDRVGNFGLPENRYPPHPIQISQDNEVQLPSSNNVVTPSAPLDPRLRSSRLSLTSPPKLVPVPPRTNEIPVRVNEEDLRATTDFDYRSIASRVDNRNETVPGKAIYSNEFQRNPVVDSADNFTKRLPLNNIETRLECTDLTSTNTREELVNETLSRQLHESSKDWKKLGFEKKKKQQSNNQPVRNVSSTSAPANVNPQTYITSQSNKQTVRPVSAFSSSSNSKTMEVAQSSNVPSDTSGVTNASNSSPKTSEKPHESKNTDSVPEVPKLVVPVRRKKNPLMPEFV